MRFTFVGDIALGDHPKTIGFGFRSRYARGIPASLGARILPPGPAPDLIFGNLEFALGAETTTVMSLAQRQCRGIAEYAEFLAGAGVRALNVANNHSAQHGRSSFLETVAVLRSSGIHVVGTPADFTDAGVLVLGDCRIALLGWSDRPRQYASDAPPYNELSEVACSQIAEAKRRADLVIASVHWGEEFILLPSERERRIARAMVDAGASFVVGHHPHVMREVERYRDGLIAYSLGNFICDMTWDVRTRLSGWLTAQIEDGRITSSELTAAMIDDDYFPRPLTDPAGLRVVAKIARARRAQAERVARTSYERVADVERRWHASRTAWMILRHLHHYPRGVALDLLRSAFVGRMQGMLARVARGRH